MAGHTRAERAIDRLRQIGTRQRLADAVVRDQPEEASDALHDTIQAGQREVVQRALAELPEDQKQALLLAYYEGLTQSEIASQLGTPLGTIKTRMRAGMTKLRGLLGNQVDNLGYSGEA